VKLLIFVVVTTVVVLFLSCFFLKKNAGFHLGILQRIQNTILIFYSCPVESDRDHPLPQQPGQALHHVA
jgi:hypothetical protein